MRYLTQLKNDCGHESLHHQYLQNVEAGSFDGFVGGSYGTAQKIEWSAPSVARRSDVTATRWLLHYADRDPVEVWCVPPSTLDDMLASSPGAFAAEPLPERSPVNQLTEPPADTGLSMQACRGCRHRARPGHAQPGYCARRTDTPHAYGLDHPLHLLPQDGGADCDLFEDW